MAVQECHRRRASVRCFSCSGGGGGGGGGSSTPLLEQLWMWTQLWKWMHTAVDVDVDALLCGRERGNAKRQKVWYST